jgi:Sulfotransferase family
MTASTELGSAMGELQEPAGSPAGGRVPDFFVIGHPKSGTTALYEMLRRHPQIYMPECKEPRFFADDMHLGPDRAKAGLPESFEQYLALFAPALPDQRAGEASPFYLASRTAAQEIAAVRPDARIVAILREPSSFLRSLHLQFVETHVEPKNSLRKALALEQARSRGRRVPRHSPFPAQALLYSHYIRYVEQLRRYNAAFGADRVLVLVYDDFRADNEATVRGVLRFLGVDEALPIAVQDANPTVRVRAQPLDELMSAVSIGRGPLSRSAKAALKLLAPRRLRHQALVAIRRRLIWSEPKPPDERLVRELRRRFSGEVAALSEYLDRDLVSLWGYDQLA